LDRTVVDSQELREAVRREGVFYETFPDLTFQEPETPVDWFEIALRASGTAVLKDLSEFLVRKVPLERPCRIDMPPAYYTFHPSLTRDRRAGESRGVLCHSVSLVFLQVVPYLKTEEPAILVELKRHLALLDVPRIEVQRV